MKLMKIQVTEFRSIRDSNAFDVGDITCLVGKNESGKTAILHAIRGLNPLVVGEGKFDVTDDYPRVDVADYRQAVEAEEKDPANVIAATFVLDDTELASVEAEFGAGILQKAELTLSRGYDQTTYVSLSVSERVGVKRLLEKAQLPTALGGRFSKCDSLESLDASLSKEESTEDTEEVEHLRRLRAEVDTVSKARGFRMYIYDAHLKSGVPKFLYFDEYYQMRGHENIEALKQRVESGNVKPSDHPLLGLIELSRLDLDTMLNPQRTQELKNLLEGAGNHLTKKVLKYWSQNRNLEMRFDVRPGRPGDPDGMQKGTNVWAEVYDSKHRVTTGVGSRSRGFIWFFSFLAWFSQQQRRKEPLILLLDEPGLTLHGKAQGDLLAFIEEELKPTHQVIYTTHSPFMVDPEHFERVRIVQDKSMEQHDVPATEEGTKVLTEVLEATDDSLFPLQGALGYEIHQSLFVGPNSLVVEGASDLLYLRTISGILERQGRVGLTEKWTITPVGGADKVPTFVALLGAQKGLNIATLLDIQKKDRQSIENLYRRKLLVKKNVLTFGKFMGVEEADIEDMFGEDFYLQLVADEFKGELAQTPKKSALPHGGPRMLPRLEQFFSEHPMKKGAGFSHYRPARYFAEHVGELESKVPTETLDRFEEAFKALSALL